MIFRQQRREGVCTSAGRVTAQILLSFLALSSSSTASAPAGVQAVLPLDPSFSNSPLREAPAPADHVFTLRHVFHHGVRRYPRLHRRQDIATIGADLWLEAEDGHEKQKAPPLRARSSATNIQRLVDRRPSVVDPLVATARENGYVSVLSADAWTVDEVSAPDVTSKDTILTLAYMASNAYVDTPEYPDWKEVGEPFNHSASFGWEDDGLRGHIFADADNGTIVIGLKGTSMAVFDGDGTTTNDKVNDNLFFSCCCAQQGPWLWHQVCDCATGTYSCNNTCVVQALRSENRYYTAVRELYSNVTEMFPTSNIWITGHSLGGSVSALLGLTYGLPVVTFEAVPDALPASRLGLPVPPGSDPDSPQTRQDTGISHFGHTADPVYIGTCNGATASCSYAGYAMESACHTGRECVYDTVADKGWRVGIGTHKIRSVINDIILKYDTVPECKFTPECRDCANWKMYESNGTETTTTTTSSSTSTDKPRTRTQTCQTPGWWGCLDETATATATSSTSSTTTTTTSATTSTCKTPGWFGCNDKTTVTTTTTTSTSTTSTTTSSSTPTTTCAIPGRFWGCNDQSSASKPTATSTLPPTIPIAVPARSKTTPPPQTSASRPLSTTSTTVSIGPEDPPQAVKPHCAQRAWYGRCRTWDDGDGDGDGDDDDDDDSEKEIVDEI